MKIKPIIHAVVPAAGLGSRMKASQPKQYCKAAGQTILEHTLQRLLAVPLINSITVAIARDDATWPTLPISQHPKVNTVWGGHERSDSVLSALMTLEDDQHHWALVHDAARPCVRVDSILQLIEMATSHQGAILAVPVADTLKRVASDEIELTVSRENLYQAQTPQLFPVALLKRALLSANEQSIAVTDEASAIEALGYRPKIVEGCRDNIKVTYPEDLSLVEKFLSC